MTEKTITNDQITVLSKAVPKFTLLMDISTVELAPIIDVKLEDLETPESLSKAFWESSDSRYKALILISIFKNIDSLFNNLDLDREWLHGYHEEFKKSPMEMMVTEEGLLRVNGYLEYFIHGPF